MGRYQIKYRVTDPAPGWKLGPRFVLPRRYVVDVDKLVWFPESPGQLVAELTAGEVAALRRGERLTNDHLIGIQHWLELEIESSPSQPPRCVALHAPGGIGTSEQRFPIAGLVAEASAGLSSANGSWEPGKPFDFATGDDYQDMLFEAKRSAKRRRTREPITAERLAEIAAVANQHPRAPTAAVQRRFRISRGYALRLRKLAEANEQNERKEQKSG